MGYRCQALVFKSDISEAEYAVDFAEIVWQETRITFYTLVG